MIALLYSRPFLPVLKSSSPELQRGTASFAVDELFFVLALVLHLAISCQPMKKVLMPRLKTDAVNRWMIKRNILSKFALSQISGISYGFLREILSGGRVEVAPEVAKRLIQSLGCEPGDILEVAFNQAGHSSDPG